MPCHVGIPNPDIFFSKLGFRVWTRSNPGLGFGFWIFTNENEEADDRIEENFTENSFIEGLQSCFVTVQ